MNNQGFRKFYRARFDNGEIIAEIIPELWLLRRHGLHLDGPYLTRGSKEITVASKKE